MAPFHVGARRAARASAGGIGAAMLVLAAVTLLWPGWARRLVSAEGFMPHGHCYLWKPGLVWLHVASDSLIGLAYVSISLTLAYLVYRARGDIPFHWVLLAFGAFIIACGATHWMEIWTLYSARYWLSGGVKVVTALVSVLTAAALPPLVPGALHLVESARLSEARNAERERAVAAEQRQAQRIRSLQETSAVSNASYDGQLDAAIQLGRQWFGLETGGVTRVPHDVPRSTPVARAARGPFSFEGAPPAGTADDGTRAFIGTPLVVNGEHFGALTFAGRSFRGAPFDAGDHDLLQLLARWMGTVLERKQAAEEIARARDAALESARLKSEFVSTMSHELRTPLNVIIGYSDMMAESAFGPLPDAYAEVVGRVRRSSVELLELVNATLHLGRIEANRETIQVGPVDLDELFAEIEAQVEVLMPEDVALHWRNALGTEPVVTDRTKLKTILGNLVGNALKFTDHGEIEVSARAAGRFVVITVRDTGIGIAPDQLPVIFDMFRQADGSSTRRYSGVGLGLHIVRRLADLMGATIDVESAPGVGSTFSVTLPAAA